MSLSVDWLAEQVAADFVARNVLISGIEPTVLYGTEKFFHGKPGPRVIIGLNPSFAFGPPSGPKAPGVATIPGLATPAGARSVMSRLQAVLIDVKVPPPSGTDRDPTRSLQAHRACAQLVHETCASLYRKAHGSVAMDGGEWIGTATADLHYPAQARIRCTISMPVLDVMWPKMVPAAGPGADPPEPSPMGPSSVYAVDPGDGSETLDVLTPGT